MITQKILYKSEKKEKERKIKDKYMGPNYIQMYIHRVFVHEKYFDPYWHSYLHYNFTIIDAMTDILFRRDPTRNSNAGGTWRHFPLHEMP